MAITLKQRAYAGMWFMAAALIPLLFIIWNFLFLASESHTLELVIWFMIAPLLISGLLGSLVGAGILNPYKVTSGWHAALRGFIISVLAFLLSSILISAWDSYNNEYTSFIGTLFMMLVVGSMVIGWLATIIGTFAGWLLYQRRTSRPHKTDLP
ncbi:MAG TPA: hypothetical protein VM911_20155 [Pyrinomonadaceae bacterium]|jgi:hypothetical protein|nr:hypothetical protein [Pyrinomonadaceae bacterium]